MSCILVFILLSMTLANTFPWHSVESLAENLTLLRPLRFIGVVFLGITMCRPRTVFYIKEIFLKIFHRRTFNAHTKWVLSEIFIAGLAALKLRKQEWENNAFYQTVIVTIMSIRLDTATALDRSDRQTDIKADGHISLNNIALMHCILRRDKNDTEPCLGSS